MSIQAPPVRGSDVSRESCSTKVRIGTIIALDQAAARLRIFLAALSHFLPHLGETWMRFSHVLWAAALTAIFITALATIPRRLPALRRYRSPDQGTQNDETDRLSSPRRFGKRQLRVVLRWSSWAGCCRPLQAAMQWMTLRWSIRRTSRVLIRGLGRFEVDPERATAGAAS